MKDPSKFSNDVENPGNNISMPPEEAGSDSNNRYAHKSEPANGTSAGASVASESSKKKIEDEKTNHKLVSVREVFSFARTPKSKLCIVGSFVCASISGACMPGTLALIGGLIGHS
jgi:hypothetical protein